MHGRAVLSWLLDLSGDPEPKRWLKRPKRRLTDITPDWVWPEPVAARGYRSPAAFRRALTDKLAAVAQTGQMVAGPATAPDRLRPSAGTPLRGRRRLGGQGTTALLARDLGVCASIDVDVFCAAALEIAGAN